MELRSGKIVGRKIVAPSDFKSTQGPFGGFVIIINSFVVNAVYMYSGHAHTVRMPGSVFNPRRVRYIVFAPFLLSH